MTSVNFLSLPDQSLNPPDINEAGPEDDDYEDDDARSEREMHECDRVLELEWCKV